METPTELEVVSADPVANSVTIGWRWSTFSRLGEWVVPTGFVVERSIDGGEWVVLTYSVTSNEMPAGRRACKLVDSDILMGETSPNGIYFEGPVVNSTISYHRPALEEVLGDQDWYIWHDPVVGWVLGMHLGVLTEPYWFRGGDVNGQYAPSPGSGAFSATVTDATAETSSLSESESSGWRRYTYTDMLSLADATAVFAVGVPVSYRVRAYLVT